MYIIKQIQKQKLKKDEKKMKQTILKIFYLLMVKNIFLHPSGLSCTYPGVYYTPTPPHHPPLGQTLVQCLKLHHELSPKLLLTFPMALVIPQGAELSWLFVAVESKCFQYCTGTSPDIASQYTKNQIDGHSVSPQLNFLGSCHLIFTSYKDEIYSFQKKGTSY